MKKILIVDDSLFMRGVLKDILNSDEVTKAEIFEADGKETALAALKKTQFDLVLLDIVMNDSELDGVHVLQEIKLLYPKTKVIISSSIGQHSVLMQLKKLGADNYIQKPFACDAIIKIVNEHLK